ncbi:MAG: hypothetical protein JWO31_676 [Phycisphaerales bacterium]|nr:hypothetical protein [Phycisphaerales bacterium]
MTNPLGIVFAADPTRPWMAARSGRSLTRAGVTDVHVIPAGDPLPSAAGRPVVLLRAGAWLRATGPVDPPPASATGRAVVGIGVPASGATAAAWHAAWQRCGGDFSTDVAAVGPLPPIVCAWVGSGDGQAAALAALTVADAAAGALAEPAPFPPGCRVVHWTALDVHADDGLRVAQVVTTLQHGGAERVTWDLHDLLPALGVASCLVTLGTPSRRPLPNPPGRVDLSARPPEDRVAAAADVAARFGADLIHAHLIRGADADRLAASGVPLVMTVHNTRPGWPPGLADVAPGSAALLVACARAVERDLVAAGVPAPVRTAWNGINVGAYERKERASKPAPSGVAAASSSSSTREGGARAAEVPADSPSLSGSTPPFRAGLSEPTEPSGDASGWDEIVADRLGAWPMPPPALVLACVANPRPQKRLDRLPGVLAAVRAELARRGDPRDARLVIAGEAAPNSSAAD